MKNVLVFFGGESVEHDVSILSGVLILNSLKKSDYNPVPVFVSKEREFFTGKELFEVESFKNLNLNKLKRVTFVSGSSQLFYLKRKKLKPILHASVAINCMHGGIGENGSLSGILNFSGIPLASPEILPSAVCMSKSFTKTVLKGLKINCLDCEKVKAIKEIRSKEWNFPLIVKPDELGSSIGITKANDLKELENAVLVALKYSPYAIIEPCLTEFTEINCACYGIFGKVFISPCERPIGNEEVLSFNDKYVYGEREFPAKIKKQHAEKIKDITEKIYRELKFRGVIRVDFLIDKSGKIFVNEINTTPGSLAYYLFSETLEDFSVILADLLKEAEQNFNAEKTLIKKYSSSILNGVGTKGAKRLENEK